MLSSYMTAWGGSQGGFYRLRQDDSGGPKK
jgi:hypothetical protein